MDGVEITVMLSSSPEMLKEYFRLVPSQFGSELLSTCVPMVLSGLAHRVRTEEGNAPVHDGLVFFWSSCLAIVELEFGKIRPDDDFRNAAVSLPRRLALRIGTIKIGLLAVLLKRDRNGISLSTWQAPSRPINSDNRIQFLQPCLF